MIPGRLASSAFALALVACPQQEAKQPYESAEYVAFDASVSDKPPQQSADTYVYLTKRPLAVVGLAEARNMDDALAKQTVDRIADVLDACATEQARAGKLVDGAARLIVQISPEGQVEGINVKMEPGGGVAANGLLCLVSPVKLMSFSRVDAGTRAFAIEALWGSSVMKVAQPPARGAAPDPSR